MYHKHEKALLDMLQGQVPRILNLNGFIDVGEGKGNTIPTKVMSEKISKPELRLDYAFVSAAVEVKLFDVVRNEITDRSSDHYPIVIEVS